MTTAVAVAAAYVSCGRGYEEGAEGSDDYVVYPAHTVATTNLFFYFLKFGDFPFSTGFDYCHSSQFLI